MSIFRVSTRRSRVRSLARRLLDAAWLIVTTVIAGLVLHWML